MLFIIGISSFDTMNNMFLVALLFDTSVVYTNCCFIFYNSIHCKNTKKSPYTKKKLYFCILQT